MIKISGLLGVALLVYTPSGSAGQVSAADVQFDTSQLKGDRVSIDAQTHGEKNHLKRLAISIEGKRLRPDRDTLNSLEYVRLNTLKAEYISGCILKIEGGETCLREYRISFFYGSGCMDEYEEESGDLRYELTYKLASKTLTEQSHCRFH